MSKVLKIAAVVVGVAAIAVATGGIGVGAGIGAVGGTTVSAAAAGGLAATSIGVAGTAAVAGGTLFGLSAGTLFLASTALNLAAGLTAKKPTIAATGVQTQFNADPNAGIPYLMGRTGTGGFIVFRSNADGWSDKTPNDLDDFVVVHSLGPIQGFESFTADQVGVSFDGSGNAGGSYSGFMWQKRQLGLCPEGAALAVSAGASARPSGWGTEAKLSGLAAAQWRLRFDAKGNLYQGGTPKPQWVVLGVKVYDPRLDSTYPGGSGTCRANDEATWVYSANPYLHALTWLIGRHQNGQRIMGVGMPVNGIIVASFVEGANVADANGWKLGGSVYSTDNKYEVLKAILQAGGGEPLRLGSQIGCLINTPRVSLATITIDDLAQGEVSVQATQPQRNRINGVIPRYRSEDHQWDIVPGAPVRVADYVTVDGGQRTREIEYGLVQVEAGQPVVQPAQLARYDIQNAREFGPINLPLKLRWYGYKPGDCLTANLPEIGLVLQPILMLNRGLDPGDGVVSITARSETAAKHAFALGQTTTPPPTPGVSGPPLVPTPASGDWAISATSISSGGVTVPALVITGAAPTSVEQVVFEYRVYTGAGMSPDEGWAAAGTELPQVTTKVISTVQAGTSYQASVRYVARGTLGGRLILGPTTSSAWSGVTGGVGATNSLVQLFKRSATTPALPSATVTYTYANGTFSGLTNGWSGTPPSSDGDPLWVIGAVAHSTGPDDTIAAGEWSTPEIEARDGEDGLPGYSRAPLRLWQRAASAPATPSSTSTYTFATDALTGFNNGWSATIPANDGNPLWVTTAAAIAPADQPTDTIAGGEWAAAQKEAENGASGVPGFNNFSVPIYQRSSSGAPALPTATATWTFSTRSISGLNNGWSQFVPGGTGTLYVSAAVASSQTDIDTIASGEWAAAQVWAAPGADGSHGLNSHIVELLQRNNTGIAPAAPSVTTTWTFATSSLSGANNGWTQAMPAASAGKYLFVTRAAALNAGPTDDIAFGEWSPVETFVKDGEKGDEGDPGPAGFTLSGGGSASVAATALGVPKTGELPKTFTMKLMQGTVDRSDEGATTYGITASSGCTASLGGTNGKVLSITAMSADTASVTVTIYRSGGAIGTQEIKLSKARDGGAANANKDDTLAAMPASSTPAQLGSFTILVPNGASLSISAEVQYFGNGAGTNTYGGQIRASYTVDGTETFGSWYSGDITASDSEIAYASFSGDPVYANTSGTTKEATVKLYGRRSFGTSGSSGTSGKVEGSVA